MVLPLFWRNFFFERQNLGKRTSLSKGNRYSDILLDVPKERKVRRVVEPTGKTGGKGRSKKKKEKDVVAEVEEEIIDPVLNQKTEQYFQEVDDLELIVD